MKRILDLALSMLLLSFLSGSMLSEAVADPIAAQASLVEQATEQGLGGDLQKCVNNILNTHLGEVTYSYPRLRPWTSQYYRLVRQLAIWLSENIAGVLSSSAQRLLFIVEITAVGNFLDSVRAGISTEAQYFYLYYFSQDCLVLALARKKLVDTKEEKLVQAAGMIFLFPFLVRVFWIGPWIWWQIRARADGDAMRQAVAHGLARTETIPFFDHRFIEHPLPTDWLLAWETVYCCSLIAICWLVLILISHMLKVLPVMIMRSTLAFSLCLVAPYFLSLRAVDGKERLCADFLRIFVELNLWQVFWVGILNVISLTLHGQLHPWIKVIVIIFLLRCMRELPAMLAITRLSPVSLWIKAGEKRVCEFRCRLLCRSGGQAAGNSAAPVCSGIQAT